mgnify:CR=1 FL=1
MLQWWYGYSDADREGFVEYMNESETQTGPYLAETKMLNVTQKFNWSLEQYEFVMHRGYAGKDGLVLHMRKIREAAEMVDPLSDPEGVLGGGVGDDNDDTWVDPTDTPREHGKNGQVRTTRSDNHATRGPMSELGNDDWSIRERDGDFGDVTDIRFKVTFLMVPRKRIVAATKLLKQEDMQTCMTTSSCWCKRKCYKYTNLAEVQQVRESLVYSPTRQDANQLILQKLRSHDGSYKIRDRECCLLHYAKAHGRCTKTVAKIKRTACKSDRSVLAISGKGKACPDNENPQYLLAKNFWTQYYDKFCQKPNDDIRLFPTDRSMSLIYKEDFTPWCNKLFAVDSPPGGPPIGDIPSKSTWYRAKADEDFYDVKKRKHHLHSRCHTCATIEREMAISTLEAAEHRRLLADRRMHSTAVRNWRDYEESLKALAKMEPHRIMVICHDATGMLGTPRVGKRSDKNLTMSRFNWVPWLAHTQGSDEYDYVYHPKGKWKTDANYIITLLQALVHRAKSNYDHPNHRARRVVFVADNASENKCNELFAWAEELVEAKWFDEVEFVFGVVGHTHNGVDACHCTHNQKVGALFAGDIGHFVDNYKHVFNKFTPRASILTEVRDWKKYYDGYLRKISGFTKTPLVPLHDTCTCILALHAPKTKNAYRLNHTPTVPTSRLYKHHTRTIGQAHRPRVQSLAGIIRR